jgi:hypothetical protein
MNMKKEYWIGGLILAGVALYLISQKDGVFATTPTLNLNNLKK